MEIIERLQQKLSERHQVLLGYGKVTEVIKVAGMSPNAYTDAVTGKEVRLSTLERVDDAQTKVIKDTEDALLQRLES